MVREKKGTVPMGAGKLTRQPSRGGAEGNPREDLDIARPREKFLIHERGKGQKHCTSQQLNSPPGKRRKEPRAGRILDSP